MGASYGIIATATGFSQIVAGTLLAGLGLGATTPNQNSWLMTEVAEAARGKSAGVLITLFFAGQFVVRLIAGALGAFMTISRVFATFSAALLIVGPGLLIRSATHKPQPI
jgi:hypothetical protein